MSGSGFNELINFFRQIRSDQREDYQKVIDDLYSAVSLIDDEYKPVVKERISNLSSEDKDRIFAEYKKGKSIYEITYNSITNERILIQLFSDKIKSEHLKVFVDYDLYSILYHSFIDAWIIFRAAEFLQSNPTKDVQSLCSFVGGICTLPSQLNLILALIDVFNHNFSSFSAEARGRFESLFSKLKQEAVVEFDFKRINTRIIEQTEALSCGDRNRQEVLDDLGTYMKALDIACKEYNAKGDETKRIIQEYGFPEIDLTSDIVSCGIETKQAEKLNQMVKSLSTFILDKKKYPREFATGEHLYNVILNINIGLEVYVRVIYNDNADIYLGEIKDLKTGDRFAVKLKNNTISSIREVTVTRAQIGFSKAMLDYIYPVGTRVMALFTPRTKDERAHFNRSTVWLQGTVGDFDKGEYLIFFDLDIDAYVEMNKVMLHFDQIVNDKRNNDDFEPRVEPRENYKKLNNAPRAEFLKRYLCGRFPLPVYEGNVGDSLRAKDGKRRYKATIIKVNRLLYLLRFPKNDRTNVADQGHDCTEVNCVTHNHADRWVYKGSSTRLDIPEVSKSERRRQQQVESREIEDEDPLVNQRARKSAVITKTVTTNTRKGSNKLAEQKKAKAALQIKKVELRAPNWENSLDWKDHDRCNPSCWESRKHITERRVGVWPKVVSPYFKPLMNGWTRVIMKVAAKNKKSFSKVTTTRKDFVYYISPCGRRLYELEDIAAHLGETNSPLPIMWFNLRSALDPETLIVTENEKILDKDFSLGMEGVPIPVINNVDLQSKPKMVYNSTRFARSELVNKVMEDSRNARSCCSCTDNCSDRNRCECQKLTIVEHDRLDKQLQGTVNTYDYGTLESQIGSGIYECNSKCLCSKDKCFNYLSQRKIEIPIALFMTPHSGWGVRTLIDIPTGAFISTYSGEILTDEQVEELGEKEGVGRDMYYADMDFYRSMEDEKLKRGFDIPDEGIGIDEDFPDETQIMRKYFNQDHPFTIDAFLEGNIGRFYNHSCNPNMFVQNIFTDTHDFRFPVISFFAAHDIAAGAELTWNYNYENHQKVKCYCGAPNCRGFLM